MRFLSFSSCFGLLLLAAGCGGNVILDGSSGGAPGGGGAVGAGAGVGFGGSGSGVVVVSGAGGAGGVGGSSSVTVSVSSTSGGGAGGSSPGCGATYFQLVITDAAGNDTPVSLTSSCFKQNPPVPYPFAYLTEGGPPGNPGTLTLEGCASPGDGPPGIQLTVPGAIMSGTYPLGNASLRYVDANGVLYTELLGGTLLITDFQPPGGQIVGTFQTKAVDATQGVPLEAKFAVCRLSDENVP